MNIHYRSVKITTNLKNEFPYDIKVYREVEIDGFNNQNRKQLDA